ncbi:MAG: hypothetical protein M3R17_18860 [Bacteroidota bacterium]|nr:hypothetical protein [Bacteroidota bacterium]
MIRKTFAIILFSVFSLPLFSQGKFEGGIYTGYFQIGERGFNEFGLMFHIPVGRATLNYHFGLGSSLNSGVYAHSTAGAVAGVWLLNELGASGIDAGYLSFLFCIMPEGVGYYLPTKGKITTHISVNPLSVEYFYRGRTGEEWGKMSCDVVARFKMRTNFKMPVYFAPQVAGTIIYTPGQMTGKYGFKAGFTIGFESRD